MNFSISNSFDFNSTYTTVSDSVSISYHNGITWIQETYHYLSPKLLEIGALAGNHLNSGLKVAATFFWDYRAIIIGGLVIGVALLIIHYYRKNQPERPIFTVESTGNVAIATIEAPERTRMPVNIVVAMDLSKSMRREKRNTQMQEALYEFLDKAQGLTNTAKEAFIKITLVTFREKAETLDKGIRLLPNTGKVIEEIKAKIKNLVFDGGTELIPALDYSTDELKSMAGKGINTVLFFTDGELNQGQKIDKELLKRIHTTLDSFAATVYAIGIGPKHDKETLGKIAPKSIKGLNGFQGVYIDTTKKEMTIADAVDMVYRRTFSVFRDLMLTIPQLPPHTWSVINPSNGSGKSGSHVLGELEEGKKIEIGIVLHFEQFEDSLNLSPLKIELSYQDPIGKAGKIQSSWNADTIAKPHVALAANRLQRI
jgi:Mg-chelatase subunit ChlD